MDIGIWVFLEPINHTHALRNLMRNLSIGALVFLNESKGFAYAFCTANVEPCPLADVRLIKKPRIHGTCPRTGGTVPGNVTTNEIRIAYLQLIKRDPRPAQGRVNNGIGRVYL